MALSISFYGKTAQIPACLHPHQPCCQNQYGPMSMNDNENRLQNYKKSAEMMCLYVSEKNFTMITKYLCHFFGIANGRFKGNKDSKTN